MVVTTSPAVPILKPVKWKPRPKPAKPATPAPTPARPAAPVSVPSGAAGERWAIQLGLFSTLEKAHLTIEKLHETNPDLQAEIRKGTKDDQVVYRVIAGSFPSQSEAYTRAKALAEAGLPGFSVKVDAALGTLVK
ncbi:MAG: SPOR domain-containing protein [Proteobacteria bacterium]|nr:SPOR domain-containing protein [Pseudomonadota bacterium]